MNVVLWIAQGLVALGFVGAGVMKLKSSDKELRDQLAGLPPAFGRGMGVLDMIAAVGVIVPAATGIVPVLTPVAAVGCAVVNVGAIPVHVKLKDPGGIITNVVLLGLAILVAWGRFGPYAL